MSRDTKQLSVEFLGSLRGHNGWVTSLAVGTDANGQPLLVSGSRDRSLIVWNLNLENREEIPTEENEVTDWKVGKPFRSLRGHSHFVSSLSISNDSKYVVSGSWDKTLRLWDLNTMTTRQIFSGHEKDVLAVAFSQDNRMIFSGGMDKTLRFWNTKGENKYVSKEFNGWVSCITHVKKEKDSSLLAVGSWDSKVRIFDSEMVANRSIEAQDYAVVSMASDDDGDFLFVGQKNGSIKIWNMANDQSESDTLKQNFDINADLHDLLYDTKYLTCITLATSQGISVRDIKDLSVIYQRSYSTKGSKEGRQTYHACLSLAWDATRTYLFAGFTDGVIRVYKFGYEN